MMGNKGGRDISGIVLLDKSEGITSSQAVLRVRRLFNAKKAGHTGTLDPLADGLLPICLGEAAKFSAFFLHGDKRYLAEGTLGMVTTTCDREGEVTATCEVGDAVSRLPKVLEQFKGEIIQKPPIYSAVKVKGRTLYRYAREGREVEIPERKVTIYALNLLETTKNTFKVEVYCSSGTYIRSLIADIGRALGVGAFVSKLRRTKIDGLPPDMISLELLEEIAASCQKKGDYSNLDKLLYPVDLAVATLPVLNLPLEMAEPLSHGVRQDLGSYAVKTSPDNLVQVCYKGAFLGVCTIQDQMLIPKRMMSSKELF